MELILAVLLCLFFITVIVGGEIYLQMDKQKTRALVCVRKMAEHLDAWVSLTVAMPDDQKAAAALRSLSERYSSCRKYRDTLTKISIVNEMAALSSPLLVKQAAGRELDGGVSGRAAAAGSLGSLRTEYNLCVRKLNGRLDKKIPAAIGKLFRLRKLEELCDLTET